MNDYSVVCPCGSPMVLKPSRYGMFYGCSTWPQCDNTHGAHPDGSPLGVPANKETRQARIKAHATFDDWWKRRGWRRKKAYRWLKQHGPRPHIGEMSKDECDALIQRCTVEQTNGSP